MAVKQCAGASAGFCSDTGGSCRIPASMTGTIGFRPSVGCWNSADGVVPMTYTRDTVGNSLLHLCSHCQACPYGSPYESHATLKSEMAMILHPKRRMLSASCLPATVGSQNNMHGLYLNAVTSCLATPIHRLRSSALDACLASQVGLGVLERML